MSDHISQRFSAFLGCGKHTVGSNFESVSPEKDALRDSICTEHIALVVTDHEANSALLQHAEGGG